MAKQAQVIDLDTKRLAAKVKKLLGAESEIAKHERIAGPLRLEVARELAAKRNEWPERGPKAKGWGEFLESIGMPVRRAHELIQLIVAPREDFGGSPKPSPANLNQATDHTHPVLMPPANRDAWCTPKWLCDALPFVDLDPCSNPRSAVRAKKKYSIEAGQNGILLPWFGLVYVNGPYSDLTPFAQKLDVDYPKIGGAGFLVNADHSPEWWHTLTKRLHLRLDFNVRLEFDPPPGVEPSKNDRPQTMLMDDAFWSKCDQRALLDRAQLWRKA